jgi:hypothetical protein
MELTNMRIAILCETENFLLLLYEKQNVTYVDSSVKSVIGFTISNYLSVLLMSWLKPTQP